MKIHTPPAATLVLAGLCLTCTSGAFAQSAGSLLGRISGTQISHEKSDGALTPPIFADTRATVKDDTRPTAGLTYMVNDNIAIDVPLALGFKHDIEGAGAIEGVGKIGEVKAWPVTLMVQYRFFDASSPLRPYAGIGPTYAKFYKARSTLALTSLTGGNAANPTTLSVDSKFTFTVQAGLIWQVTPKFFVDAAVMKTPLKTRTTLSTGQTLDAKLDPVSVSVGVGMKF